MAFIILLFVPNFSLFWWLGKAVLREGVAIPGNRHILASDRSFILPLVSLECLPSVCGTLN